LTGLLQRHRWGIQAMLACAAAWSSAPAIALDVALSDPAMVLDIALSNDDGWSSPGIQALRETFERAGHHVTLAAPANQQSGSSAALSTGQLSIKREAANEFSVHACQDRDCLALDGAEPATSALIAIDIATRRNGGRKPDLLISGINSGANTGGASQVSGTVGAAIAASTRAFGGNVPAIAISTDEPSGCGSDAGCLRSHYQRVAEFALRLVGRLAHEATRGGARSRLLPDGVALNVNHPPAEPKGVRVSRQGNGLAADGRLSVFTVACDGCQELAVGASTAGGRLGLRADDAPDLPGSDALNYLEGYITIVPMLADYTAQDVASFKTLLEGGGWALIKPDDGD
jgi:5'-nucleotidase